MVLGCSHRRGAMNSQKSPSPSNSFLTLAAPLSVSAGGRSASTTSSSWHWTPSKPSFLYSRILAAKATSLRTVGPKGSPPMLMFQGPKVKRYDLLMVRLLRIGCGGKSTCPRRERQRGKRRCVTVGMTVLTTGTGPEMRIRMSKRLITVGHSPDPDDAFMFYALAHDKLDTGDLQFRHELQDIETLNRRALRGELEVTAVSIHAYAHLQDKYALLPSGCSMGDRYGPMVVAPRKLTVL